MTTAPIEIVADFWPGDATGLVFTLGCHANGKPELLVNDVPRERVELLAGLLNFAATRTLVPNETIQSAGLIMVTKGVAAGEARQFRRLMAVQDKSVDVIELLPGIIGHTPSEWADAALAESVAREGVGLASSGAAAA